MAHSSQDHAGVAAASAGRHLSRIYKRYIFAGGDQHSRDVGAGDAGSYHGHIVLGLPRRLGQLLPN
jgi:hypothetical protein